MKVDEMIESIEVVKGGRVTGLVVQGLDGRVEKFVMPFDSVPPSLVVVSRKGLVKVLDKAEKAEKLVERLREGILILQRKCSAQQGEINRLTPQTNRPLTFEQLKKRIGKPVYCKRTDEWYILLDARNTPWSPNAEPELSIVAGRYVKYDPEKALYYDRE